MVLKRGKKALPYYKINFIFAHKKYIYIVTKFGILIVYEFLWDRLYRLDCWN